MDWASKRATTQRKDVDIPAEFDLDVPHDILALAERFWMEWCNGGFAQLFGNWNPADVKLIPQGLRGVGAPEAAAIVEQAIAELGTPDQWRDQGHRALTDLSDPLGSRLWELNLQFDAHERNLEKLMADYELRLSEAEDTNQDDDHDPR
jgi:hypothetical protein